MAKIDVGAFKVRFRYARAQPCALRMLPTTPLALFLQVVGVRGKIASRLDELLTARMMFVPIISGAGKVVARSVVIIEDAKELISTRDVRSGAGISFSVSEAVKMGARTPYLAEAGHGDVRGRRGGGSSGRQPAGSSGGRKHSRAAKVSPAVTVGGPPPLEGVVRPLIEGNMTFQRDEEVRRNQRTAKIELEDDPCY